MNVQLPYFKRRQAILRSNAEDQTDWAFDQYQFDKQHEMGLQGQHAVVAILDTGWNHKHPDLLDASVKKVGNHWEGENILHVESFVDRKDPYDRNFHSTWIHGALGAVHNGFGVKGRLPKAKFVIFKVLQDDGSGSIDAVIKALDRCVDLGYITDAIMSLGLNSHVPALKRACDRARKNGIWLHCAAGNDYGQNAIDHPASYESCLAYGSHDINLKKSAFSDTGILLDLYGPGENVLSCFGYQDYALNDGTSMAGPNAAASVIIVRKSIEQAIGREMDYNDLYMISSPINQIAA